MAVKNVDSEHFIGLKATVCAVKICPKETFIGEVHVNLIIVETVYVFVVCVVNASYVCSEKISNLLR